MKTRKLFWILFILLIGSVTVNAQGRRNPNRPGMGYGAGNGFGPGYNIWNMISGLSEEQQTQITELRIDHQKTLAELRVKQSTTTDVSEKAEIRDEMLRQVLAHRDQIRNVLTEEQQKQFDSLRSGYNYGRGGIGYGRGRWGGRGLGGFGGGWCGRGPGYGRQGNFGSDGPGYGYGGYWNNPDVNP